MWNLDGVVITDTTSGGASSMYFDFDAFDEVAVNTGGNDLKVQTGGIGINFVTRRGTNQFKGSAKFTLDNDSHGVVQPARRARRATRGCCGVATRRTTPTRSRTGASTSAGRSSRTGCGSGGRTATTTSRSSASIRPATRRSSRTPTPRSTGPRPRTIRCRSSTSTARRRSSAGRRARPATRTTRSSGTRATSIRETAPCNRSTALEGRGQPRRSARTCSSTRSTPGSAGATASRRAAAPTRTAAIDFDNDHAYGSWFTYTARKPWHIVDVSGSAFKSAAGGNHEFKFGFGYRRNPNHSTTRWSGSEVVGSRQRAGNDNFALAYRARVVNFVGQNYDAFVGDTFSRGRLTVNGGIRWDRQNGRERRQHRAGEHDVPGSAAVAVLRRRRSDDRLERHLAARRRDVSRSTKRERRSPARRTPLRRAAEPVRGDGASPVGGYYTFIAYRWVDTNRDGFAQKNEILTNLGPQYANAIDPAHPTSVVVAEHDRPELPRQPRQRVHRRPRSRGDAELRRSARRIRSGAPTTGRPGIRASG